MTLKPDDQLATAVAVNYTGLTEERKQQLIATIRATRPEKLDELHGVFTQPGAGLQPNERAFYDAIVDVSGLEPVLETVEPPTDAIPAAPVTTPTNGKPARQPFTPGAPATTSKDEA